MTFCYNIVIKLPTFHLFLNSIKNKWNNKMKISCSKSSILIEDSESSCIKEYYNYIIELIKIICLENDLSCNFIVGGNYNLDANYKIIKINYEHTLVVPGGRDSKNSPVGNIIFKNQVKYLVRIVEYHNLNQSNIIIDYSLPNIENIKRSNLYDSFSKKLIYISPYLYMPYNDKVNRSNNLLTTFINPNEPRRKKLIQEILENGLSHENVNNCFESFKLMKLYRNTKILINIHQTDHHHTFEELRVLPALLCGVIVICEESPLKELIPYHSYLIWTKYEEIIDTIKYVNDNYEQLFNKIFIESNFKLDMNTLHTNNLRNLKEMILSQ